MTSLTSSLACSFSEEQVKNPHHFDRQGNSDSSVLAKQENRKESFMINKRRMNSFSTNAGTDPSLLQLTKYPPLRFNLSHFPKGCVP